MRKNKIESTLFLALLLCATIANSNTTSITANGKAKLLDANYVQEQLTGHEWTLREIVQTKNDTAVNLTLFMLPCEKDNILDYHDDGTYIITEGEKMCKKSAEKIKGNGIWEFDESEQEIVDSYMGGRRINKKILELTTGMLKVEYEGEGNKITTLTYFSKIGLDDDALIGQIEDNSNHSNNIEQVPREVMLEARRYILIGRNDFDKGTSLEIDNKGGLMKKVMVYPFMNSTDPNITVLENERISALISQAKKIGLDYIVTGNIIKADSDINNEGKHLGHIKYSVSLVDVSTGEISANQLFEHSQLNTEKKKNKKKRGLRSMMNVMGSVAQISSFSNGFGYYGWKTNYWNSYYRSYFAAGAINLAADNLDAAFSDSDAEERTRYYKSSLAVMDAIAQTSEELGDFIIKYIPITIPINEVNVSGKGKLENLVIEAGANINIRKGEEMNLVRIKESTLSDGTIVSNSKVIAKLKVESINGTRLATCKAAKSSAKKKIAKVISENPEEIFVQTMEIPKEEKKKR